MYRLLEENDVIKENDEYYSHIYGWLKVSKITIGSLYVDTYAPIRRKLCKECNSTGKKVIHDDYTILCDICKGDSSP